MLDVAGILNALVTQAQALGVFEAVLTHEPKRAQNTSVPICAFWLNSMRPARTSGLGQTSMRVELVGRIYMPALSEPVDLIEPAMMLAADTLLTSVIGNFTFGSTVRAVDVFGSDGEQLRAVAGYLTLDQTPMRVIDVFIPLIVNDVYAEQA